jgi:hypothetical protein
MVPSASHEPSVLGATVEDTHGDGRVRGEHAGDGADDDPQLAARHVHRNGSEIERLAEWYMTRSADDPRYGEAADERIARRAGEASIRDVDRLGDGF